MEMDEKQVRVAIFGSNNVGKSCLARRFTENIFSGNPYNPTPGIDFFSRRISIKPLKAVTIVILDLSGQAIESKMFGIFIKAGIDIILLTYDVTSAPSLYDLRNWIEKVKKLNIDTSAITFALVGLKGDLEHLRAIRLDNHTRFKQEFNIPLSYIASAKSGETVQTCFSNSVLYHLNLDGKNPVMETPLAPPPMVPREIGAPLVQQQQQPTRPVPLTVSAATRRSSIKTTPESNVTPSTNVKKNNGQNTASSSSSSNSTVCSLQ